ncbi:Gfo/Idh/MocA family oxidoreductase [Flexilinea flocculi]|jgi:predicted dehydrogenase|uniref:Predicted dehydrogenase n=1 Tax=Flexilinea flocculi TaxID=1678840 RepID=A0A0K8PBQ6_9CHLR|nr:Gfo/Idh/MocA family oxidoreductase [Flexilinea flocculi]GAP39954.1 predicted dehydrogenase [Flexilinea flocculi]
MKNQVRICMIGSGRVGKNHSGIIRNNIPAAKIVALVDPIETARQETAAEYEIEEQYESLDQALERSKFDAVMITTPPSSHLPLAILAAENKKQIFLEKPMGLTMEECHQISDAVDRNHVILQLGFMRRFDPEFIHAYERIQGGEIGDPMMIKSNTHGPGLPAARWAQDLKTSNGMLSEVNSHDWDSVRWLMGANIERVYAEVANFKGASYNVTTENFYDNVLVNCKFENGGLGMISGICPCGYGYDARVEIVGTKGIMQIGTIEGEAIVVCNNRETGLIRPIVKTWPQRFAYGYINEISHFVQCVQNDQQPCVSMEDGKWAVAGVLAGTKSFFEKRPVYLNEIYSA